MPRDITRFLTTLPVTPEPGLESVDPRLIEVTDLATRRNYEVAADRVDDLLAENIYDIRLIVVYFYQIFREDGAARLAEITSAVSSVLTENFEAVGPTKRREDQFDRRIAWLFSEVVDALEYQRVNPTAESAKAMGAVTEASLDPALAAIDTLGSHLGAREFRNAPRALAKLRAWVVSQKEGLASSHPGKVSEAAPGASPAVAHANGEAPAAARVSIELVVSYRFLELRDKLRAFDLLLARGEHRKAALVAEDIQNMIDHFDPRAHFPELFASFTRGVAKHITDLDEHWQQRAAPSWRALQQYYQVDLDGFIES